MFNVYLIIDLVKARPALYNSSLFEYKSKPYCNTLWNEIAVIMGKTALECRTVWTSLRSSYARHLQNMENNKKGLNRKKKSEWYLSGKMSFLKDFMLRRPHERSLNTNYDEKLNETSNNGHDTSILTFENYNQNHAMDDSHSIVTIKSEDSYPEETNEEEAVEVTDFVRVEEVEHVHVEPIKTNYVLKKCRVQLSSDDQNIRIPKRNDSQIDISGVNVSKRLKMSPESTTSSTIAKSIIQDQNIRPIKYYKNRNEASKFKLQPEPETSLTASEEIDTAKAREDSTMMFFESILYELREFTDRNLRLFKQDILQELNKHLDEAENAFTNR